jgi:hypothetical protein
MFSLFYYYVANLFTREIKNIIKLETYEIIQIFRIIQDLYLIIIIIIYHL